MLSTCRKLGHAMSDECLEPNHASAARKTHREVASALHKSWVKNRPITGFDYLAGLRDEREGHLIQRQLQVLSHNALRKPIGWKIGLTSQAALDLFGAREPMVGILYEDRLLEDGAHLKSTQVVQPRIEGEILLEIGKIPATGASDAALRASIASASAAFEIADSRISGWPKAIGGAIADNACCGWFLRSKDRRLPAEVDLATTQLSMTLDGRVISKGSASACMGGVLNVYRWFIQDSHRRGRKLEPGEVILTGALGPAIPLTQTGTYRVDCGSLGSASLRFNEAQ